MYAKTLTRTNDEVPSTRDVDLRGRLRECLETPLSVLRATLELVVKELPGEHPQRAVLCNAGHSMERIARHAQTLADFSVQPKLCPARCSLEELARSAHQSTPIDLRNRVQVALENSKQAVFVDGPLFSRCLSYLLQACIEQKGEALLHAQLELTHARFTVVRASSFAGASRTILPRPSDGQDLNELMLLVAEREIVRMGGSFEREPSTTGAHSFNVRFPLCERIEGVA